MIMKFCCKDMKDDFCKNGIIWSQVYLYCYCPYCGKEIQVEEMEE